MGFLSFIWNFCMKILSLGFFIFLEVIVFTMIIGFVAKISGILAGILTAVFVVWIIVEIFLELVVGTTINVVKHIFFIG